MHDKLKFVGQQIVKRERLVCREDALALFSGLSFDKPPPHNFRPYIAFCLSVNATPIFSRVTLFNVPVTLSPSAA